MSPQTIRRELRSAKRLLLKVGSRSLVTEKGKLNAAVFRGLSADVAQLCAAGKGVAIVTSGAVLAGRAKLGLLGRELTMPIKQALAAVGQNVIMAEWARALARHGVVAGQVLLTGDDLRDRGRYLNSRNTIEQLLGLGVVPVINENDTVAIEEIRYGDNDHLSALVAVMMRAEVMLLLTDADGLCGPDPAAAGRVRVVGVVRESDEALMALAGPPASGVGSGGMASKVESARMVARRGVRTVIANARAEHVVARVMAGEEMGTLFVPEGRPLDDRQYWMAFSGGPRGAIKIDDGARKAIEDKGRSLLPAGVLEVRGEFDKGDLVAVVTARGREIARGLSQYSAADLARIQGRRSGEIQALLGGKLYDEAIHRDYLVLTRKK
jgi:glutamate 5-kinase